MEKLHDQHCHKYMYTGIYNHNCKENLFTEKKKASENFEVNCKMFLGNHKCQGGEPKFKTLKRRKMTNAAQTIKNATNGNVQWQALTWSQNRTSRQA